MSQIIRKRVPNWKPHRLWAVSLAAFVLLYFSDSIVTDIPGFSTLQGLTFISLGVIVLIQWTKLLYRNITHPWLKAGFILGWMPFAICAAIMISVFSMCSFEGRDKASWQITELPKGRVYVGYWGDQGALGASGEAVYWERRLLRPFYFKSLLCLGNLRFKGPPYEVIAPGVVKCLDNGKTERTFDLN